MLLTKKNMRKGQHFNRWNNVYTKYNLNIWPTVKIEMRIFISVARNKPIPRSTSFQYKTAQDYIIFSSVVLLVILLVSVEQFFLFDRFSCCSSTMKYYNTKQKSLSLYSNEQIIIKKRFPTTKSAVKVKQRITQ